MNTSTMKVTIIFVIIFTITISSGCITSPYDENYVNFICYLANYEDYSLDLNLTSNELMRLNIPFQRVSYETVEGDVINCNFGETFNDISLEDTFCEMRSESIADHSGGRWGANVRLRLYGADEYEPPINLDQYRPDLERSMDYITSIIFNATGEWPIEEYFLQEDGSPLKYP